MTKIKSISAYPPIPMLRLTGARDEIGVERGIAAGACGFIAKPFDKSMLLPRPRGLLAQDAGTARQHADGRESANRASSWHIPRKSPMRALVIDDDPLTLTLLARQLEQLGWSTMQRDFEGAKWTRPSS